MIARILVASLPSALVFAACTVMDGYTYSPPDAASLTDGAPMDGGDYATRVLASRPLAYYRFDDVVGASVARDSSGHGHDCSYASGVQLGVPGIVPTDSAARFSAQSLGVACTPPLFTFSGNTPFSVEGWFAPNTVGNAYQSMFTRVTNNPRSGYFVFLHGEEPRVGFEVWASGKAICWADDTPLPCATGREAGVGCSAFSHVVATYDGAAISVFVNGVLKATGQCPTGLPVIGDEAFTVGNYSGYICPDCGLLGDVDEVAVYDRALEPSEVQAHYAAASP